MLPRSRLSARLARPAAIDRFAGKSARERARPVLAAPRGEGLAEREVLRWLCGLCSIQIRRRPSLDQRVGGAPATARHPTQQSDKVVHPFSLSEAGLYTTGANTENAPRLITKNLPGAAPGSVEHLSRLFV